MSEEYLRPVEKRLVAMKADGLTTNQIADRLNKSPTHVARMLRWVEIPRERPAPRRYAAALEARVADMRARGMSHEEIGHTLHRSSRFSERIEHLASLREEV